MGNYRMRNIIYIVLFFLSPSQLIAAQKLEKIDTPVHPQLSEEIKNKRKTVLELEVQGEKVSFVLIQRYRAYIADLEDFEKNIACYDEINIAMELNGITQRHNIFTIDFR